MDDGQQLSTAEERESKRLREVLPQRLTQALKASGLTRTALSEIVGVHGNTIHAYASGQRCPRLSQLVALAKTLRISLDWLLDIQGTAELDYQLRPLDVEILEYIAVENRRKNFPTLVEISHAFDADPYWSSPFVRKLQRFGYVAPQPGFRLTRTGIAALPEDSLRPRPRKLPKRTPLLRKPRYRTPVRGGRRRTPV